MPKRGIRKRILNKVSALFSIRGGKHRLDIHGEQTEDCNSRQEPDINTVRGVMSSMKTPQYKPRGIRFSRRAVQRSKYLRQKFGVRKTVMGFSPRVGSITEEDESEITLWMLAENAENVISEGMAWLRDSECCEDSNNIEQEDHEKILQMWIESNSFDENDKDVYGEEDCDSSSLNEDNDDKRFEKNPAELTDDEDDNNNDDHDYPIISDCDSTGDEDHDITQDDDDFNNSYPAYNTDTDSDNEDGIMGDEDNHSVDNNEIKGDSLNEKPCSIYIDDESLDELDDDFGGGAGNQNDFHNQLEFFNKNKHQEFAENRAKHHDIILSNPKYDCCNFLNSSSGTSNTKNTLSELTSSSANEMKNIGNNAKRENHIPLLEAANSQGYGTMFDSSKDGNNNDSNMCDETVCKKSREQLSGFDGEVDGGDENRAESDLCHDNEQKTSTDAAVISTVKEEIDGILHRISQIESDFSFMRKSMNEFRSSDVQNRDTME